jgi:hypothetical protein
LGRRGLQSKFADSFGVAVVGCVVLVVVIFLAVVFVVLFFLVRLLSEDDIGTRRVCV